MKKKLSTSLTFLFKFIFPTFWIGCILLGSVALFISEGLIGFVFLAAAILIGAFMYYTVISAKAINIDQDNLYISNYFKEIIVPLENVSHISENFFISPRLITISVYDETDFGSQIKFLGYTKPFLFFSSHPAVSIINERKNIKLNRLQE